MAKASKKASILKQKEMLIVMTALQFIEDSGLISTAQLSYAKKSLQALFIHTTGEETMLRKLIEILKVNKDLHQAFSSISKISASISTSVEIITRKLNYLKQYVTRLQMTPEENSEFFAPFLSFTHGFQVKIVQFNQLMLQYLEVKESEAKSLHEFKIAQEASERLKQRLSGTLGSNTSGEVEESLRQEVVGTFDYAGAYTKLTDAQRQSQMVARQISQLLQELRMMCQMAMNPDLRDTMDKNQVPDEEQIDIFHTFTHSLKEHPRLDKIKDFIIDYFKLYQRAYGMFVLDFNNFNKAVDTIANNPAEYFDSKQEDEDIRVKRDKLRKYEGLIPFLEQANKTCHEMEEEKFTRFSRQMSEMISEEETAWEHVSELLLVSKVAAEADLTTRLQF